MHCSSLYCELVCSRSMWPSVFLPVSFLFFSLPPSRDWRWRLNPMARAAPTTPVPSAGRARVDYEEILRRLIRETLVDVLKASTNLPMPSGAGPSDSSVPTGATPPVGEQQPAV